MKEFKNLGIKPNINYFIGDKIKIDRLLNKEIIVYKYKIEDSKFQKKNNKCLYLQIKLNDMDYVVFSGSRILIEMIEQVNKNDFPFKTTIIRNEDRLEFS